MGDAAEPILIAEPTVAALRDQYVIFSDLSDLLIPGCFRAHQVTGWKFPEGNTGDGIRIVSKRQPAAGVTFAYTATRTEFERTMRWMIKVEQKRKHR